MQVTFTLTCVSMLYGGTVIYTLPCRYSIVNSTVHFTNIFGTQILTVEILGIYMKERRK